MRSRDTFVAAVRLPTRGLIVLVACLLVVAYGCGGDDGGSGGDGTGGRDGGGGATGGTTSDSSVGGGGGGSGGRGGTGGTAGTGGADGAATDAQGPTDGSADASDGGPCDDGNACTTDILSGGTCAHVPAVCMPLDQCHDAGTCDPATGVCSDPPKTDGTACNDNNSCTQTDDCQAGVCTGSNPIVCTASDQCHDVGVCEPTTGVCSNPNKVDGAACNDGDACTRADTCVAGACTGSDPVVCTALDQCHDPGTCDTATGLCSNPNKTDGTTCSDGNLCTRSDTCVAGACVGADPVSCSGTDECHTPGTCDPTTGGCSSPSAPDGTTCNDGNPCTQNSACQLGVCTGTNPIVCTALDECHDPGVCNPATGACSNPNKANGTACSGDGNACTQTDTCQNGACTGSNPRVCTALDQCHIAGVCNPADGVCSNPNIVDNAVCNDNNACTQASTCQAGTCIGTSPLVCPPPTQCQNPGTCDPASGNCNYTNRPDSTPCNDNNLCTQTDTCQAGVCVGGNPRTCTASDQCHVAGTCIPSTGFCDNPNKPDGTACNDQSQCTQTDTCQGGSCQGSDPIVCTASDQCHAVGTCNPVNGICSNPPLPDNTLCNDNNACSLTDTCQGGACTGGNPRVCDPSSQCHNAGCDPATGCTNTPKTDGSSCNDGSLCTQTDTCQAGNCTGGNPVVCTALDQCHDVGICNPANGNCSNPNKPENTLCNDQNLCTTADACRSGACSGDPVICTASDQCHLAGTCNAQTGQCSNPEKANNSPCDDQDFCTLNETCQAGACAPAGTVTCTPLDQCHNAGSCNPATGACSNPNKPDGATCDDNNACTNIDTCAAGACTGASPVACPALSPCHDPGVCNPADGSCSTPTKPNGATCNDNSACTTGETCQVGVCTPADTVVCSPSDQCHLAGICDPTDGSCTNPNKPDFTPCNDGLTCTTNDSCVNGVCSGPAPNCNDGITCTIDQCFEPGGCQSTPNPACGCSSDGECEDGNPCNGTSVCDPGGVCVVDLPPINCSPFENACNDSVCDPTDGSCDPVPRPNGTPCSDNNACTQTDACSSGSCLGANPVVCTALNSCHDVGVCDTGSGQCSNPQKQPGSSCSDGNACTNGDACGGTPIGTFECLSGPTVPCLPLGPCRDAGICDPGTGFCTDPPSPDGTPCNDNLNCTQTDVCQSGACAGTDTVICGPPGACQGPGNCIELPPPFLYTCSYPNSPDGTPCDDGTTCTPIDACAGGTCVGAPPNKCVTGPPLQAGCGDACVAQICTVDPFCCNNGWDGACVFEVMSVCGSIECSCGNGFCDAPYETVANCPQDGCTCGNGVCDPGENIFSCPGDGCCNHGNLGSFVPQSVSGSTAGQSDSWPITCVGGGPDFIYQFTAPHTGSFVFDTFGSGYDTAVAILGACGGPELACRDDWNSLQTLISINLSAGQTVYIVIDGYAAQSGAYSLNVNRCGNGVCDPGETRQICWDCMCGDNLCDASESTFSCPRDCGSLCGQGDTTCSPQVGENFGNCPECACGTDNYCSRPQGESPGACPECFCGDRVCSSGESASCPFDCSTCGDGACNPTAGESSSNCSDCFCGDGRCDQNESPLSCPDCTCGDNVCSVGEDPSSCSDCRCGNGVCDKTFEDRTTCNFDCRCGDSVCDANEQAMGNCFTDCATSCSHALCAPGSQLAPGCDPIGCVDYICNSLDASCCFPVGAQPATWDMHCVNLAQWQCGLTCP